MASKFLLATNNYWAPNPAWMATHNYTRLVLSSLNLLKFANRIWILLKIYIYKQQFT